MTAKEFAENFYLEKERLLESSFSVKEKGSTSVSSKIQELELDYEQTEKLKQIMSSLLTDAFYTILLGLDGSTSIGNSNQEVFKIYDEEENLISDCGELEVEAYEYFYNHKFESENSESDFIAELNYLATQEGGRATLMISGYRPHIKFGFDEMLTSGIQSFIGKEIVYPGEIVNAEIKILSVEYFAHKLKEGMVFEIFEGPYLVGTGKVKVIKNEVLRVHS